MAVSAEDWKSTEMIRAENALHEAIAATERSVAAADELMAAVDAEPDEELTGAEALRAYADRPDAPLVLTAAIHDVQSGLRSREDALADPAITADPVVMAALEMVTRRDAVHRGGDPRVGYDEEDFSTHSILGNE